MKLLYFARLARPVQWYKNLVVFVPLLFAGRFFEKELFLATLLGFFVLCLVSSAAYVVNDVLDREADKLHPSKKNRPIPSGKVSVPEALAFAAAIGAAALFLMFYFTNAYFAGFAILLFCSIFLYSTVLRNIPIVDVNVISFDFVIRAVSGEFITGLPFSPWLFIIIYFLALFLALGKRTGDARLLGDKASSHKEVFKFYTPEMLNALTCTTAASIIASYSLYLFVYHSARPLMVLTVPIAAFLVFRYLFFIYSGSAAAQKPERVFGDKQMLSGMLFWALLVIWFLY